MKHLRLASLFCGCGGIDLGFQGGFEFLNVKYKKHPVQLVYANDIDAPIIRLFDHNLKISADCRDIREVASDDIPDHDILTGGFPCTSFSIVAQNPPRLGVSSPDGKLFFEMCRVLREKKPTCFVAENVKGILSANNGSAFPLIMKEFRNCGYHVVHFLLNAHNFGVPQRRQRVFIVGFRNADQMDLFRPPSPLENSTVLGDVIDPTKPVDSKYYFSDKAIAGLQKANKAMNKGRVQKMDQPCNTVGSHLAKVSLNSTDPVLLVGNRYRRFTPREVARIQSFPDTFELIGPDSHQYRALGNAIPPLLMWHISVTVIRSIKDSM